MTKFLSPNDFYKFLDEDSDLHDWSFKLTPDDIKKYCTHKWVECGFMHSKIVCFHCDVLKADWEKSLNKEEKNA